MTWIDEQKQETGMPITIKPLGTIRVIFSGEVDIESAEAIDRMREIQQKAIERINRRFERLIMGRTW